MDDDIVDVTLPEGESRILLKTSQEGLSWGFCFRITDMHGEAIQNLRYSAKPTASR